jgi:hypothetical protein
MARMHQVNGLRLLDFPLMYNLVRLVMLRSAELQRPPVEQIRSIDALRWLKDGGAGPAPTPVSSAMPSPSSTAATLFDLGTVLGTGINTQNWVLGVHLIHIGALIQHDGWSGSSWVNIDPTAGTPAPTPSTLAMLATVAGVVPIFRRRKSRAAPQKRIATGAF